RYARELGERLKEHVFEEIFPHFARGFILHARQTGQIDASLESMDAEERNRLLEPYFNGTLTFLYRLLFLLYAESRDLLPVREKRGYYGKSLERIKEQIAEKAGTIEDEAEDKIRAAYHDISTRFYDELQELFRAVDKGDASLNVPVYNGGLFVTQPDPHDSSPEAEVARFLATHKIPDRELALGLDRMTRDTDDKRLDLAFIDYKSLGVRQLGSIYEGLLEFKLRVAPVEMAVVRGKKTEEIVPYAEALQKKLPILKDGRGKDAPDRTYPKGKVYLENDRRERKATGSYYTPDYIVKYIVEHTVGPVLKEKLEALRPRFREAEQTLKSQRDKEKALQKQHLLMRGDTPENETYKRYRETLNGAFFDLKVLDPAMGSGHFLVEAVDYITDQMAKFLTAFKWNPVVHELAETRREIQKEMERQDVTVDMSKLTDINLLKRQVLKRCIYGVDLNPMAVELAKVSLWLDCFTLGAPLSFLDHHMKAGNSLIGGNVQEVQEALSHDLFGHQFAGLLNATQLMRRVGSLSDVTAQEVAESRKAYQGAYDALAPFKRLLDVWISEYFGNKGAKHTTHTYADAIVADDYSKINPQDKQAITTALELTQTKRFFHWELEFPEVFYDAAERKENGGFDAVVGNPPYVRVQRLNHQETDYFSYKFVTCDRKIDISLAFLEIGNILISKQGNAGFISSSQWLATDYGFSARKFMRQGSVARIIDFGSLPVFEEASTYPAIFIFTGKANKAIEYLKVTSKANLSLLFLNTAPFIQQSYEKLGSDSWSFQELNLRECFSSASFITISEIGHFYIGALTGLDDAFIVVENQIKHLQLEKDLLLPYAYRAEEVNSYTIMEPSAYAIYPYIASSHNDAILISEEDLRNKYPKIFNHLLSYRTNLEQRQDSRRYYA
ncbi:MAG: Eco57I restriction-modification methylase domain-containing protein, partial [Chloroflexota bacterium]|nr:Eco57I restriction-modification methylase domain-containing protein [Chloroflexota bacterium]